MSFATVPELVASAEALLAHPTVRYKVPSRIHLRESLPTTATHRVAKDRVRKEYGHPNVD